MTILSYACLITVPVLAAYVWSLSRHPTHPHTVAFMTLAFAQIFHLGNARSAAPVLSLGRMSANRYALAAVAVSVGLQMIAMYVEPLPTVLHLVPLDGEEWTVVLLASALPAVVGQAHKVGRRRR
jgi:Ca2+-transporting ATPase